MGRRSTGTHYRRYDHAQKKGVKQRCRKWGVPAIHNYRPSEIYERDGWLCHWCGKPLDRALLGKGGTSPESPTIDHLWPLSRGGWDTADNVVAAHYKCNSQRSGALPLLLESGRKV